MYLCVMLLVPAVAMLADSLWMAAAMSLMPLTDRFVIPAEEALLKRLFGGASTSTRRACRAGSRSRA